MLEKRLEELLDKQEITELSGTYMRGLDRLQPDVVRSVFFEDARTDYGFFKGGPDEFADMAYNALKDHLANHHMLGQINIQLEGDVAFGEVYFQAFHRIVSPQEKGETEEGGKAEEGGRAEEGGKAEERDLFISGRYVDRYEKRGGVWKIAFRSEVSDWARNDPATDSFFRDTPTALRGGRAPDDLSCQIEALQSL